MVQNRKNLEQHPAGLSKCLPEIDGLDEITNGGLPEGRSTLVCGGPGCGKTLLATEFPACVQLSSCVGV